MTRDRLLTELQEVLDETTRDAAWSPSTMLGYLAEAQDTFCEDTGYFVDKTTFTIETIIGQKDYPLDDRIIEVYDVYNSSGTRLGCVTQVSLEAGREDSQYLIPDTGNSVGPVYEYQVDAETGTLSFLQAPDSVETFTLRCHRYALKSLDDDDIDSEQHNAEPEIPRRFRRALVAYAAAKCLMHHDTEQQDPVKAAEHMAEYRQYALRGKRARIRVEGVRRQVKPSPNYVVRP